MNPHPVAEVQRGCDDRLLVGQSRRLYTTPLGQLFTRKPAIGKKCC